MGEDASRTVRALMVFTDDLFGVSLVGSRRGVRSSGSQGADSLPSWIRPRPKKKQRL